MKRPVAIQLSSSQQAAEEGSIRRPAALLRVATRSRALHSERAHSKPVCYYKEALKGPSPRTREPNVAPHFSPSPFETQRAAAPQGEGEESGPPPDCPGRAAHGRESGLTGCADHPRHGVGVSGGLVSTRFEASFVGDRFEHVEGDVAHDRHKQQPFRKRNASPASAPGRPQVRQNDRAQHDAADVSPKAWTPPRASTP
jgi:hypothetical protein